MTANNTIDRITERFNVFEKKISAEVSDIKREIDSRFLSLENRLVKITIENDYLRNKVKAKQRISAKLKNDFLNLLCFIFSAVMIILLVNFHIIK